MEQEVDVKHWICEQPIEQEPDVPQKPAGGGDAAQQPRGASCNS